MSLLIGTQIPVLGYCASNQMFFLQDHSQLILPRPPDCHDCSDEHDPRDSSSENPCEEDHKLFGHESDDFFWTYISLPPAPSVITTVDPDYGESHFTFSDRLLRAPSPPRPPPGQQKILQRLCILRL